MTIRTYRSRATTSIGAGGRMLIATREDASPRGRARRAQLTRGYLVDFDGQIHAVGARTLH